MRVFYTKDNFWFLDKVVRIYDVILEFKCYVCFVVIVNNRQISYYIIYIFDVGWFSKEMRSLGRGEQRFYDQLQELVVVDIDKLQINNLGMNNEKLILFG